MDQASEAGYCVKLTGFNFGSLDNLIDTSLGQLVDETLSRGLLDETAFCLDLKFVC